MNKELFTVNQVADMFEMHPKTIRRYIRNGNLKAIKVGGQWRVTKDDLKFFLDSNKDLVENQTETWNEEIKEFIDGKKIKEEGKVQVFAVVDVFVDTVDEGKILANSLMKIVNNNKYEGIKPRARYLYDTEENKGRFLLYGDPKYIRDIMEKIK